jgi:hypothetical protein
MKIPVKVADRIGVDRSYIKKITQYGHKIFLSGGRPGLILDCVVARGNPADAALFPDFFPTRI